MRKSSERTLGSFVLVMGVLLLSILPIAAHGSSSSKATPNYGTAYGVSAPLGELAKLPQPVQYGFHEANPVRRIAKPKYEYVVNTAEHHTDFPAEFAIGANLVGVGKGFPGYSVPDAPPDTNMAVGDTQILQWVNVSYTICSKFSPYTCTPAILGNTLWAQTIPGTLCATNNSGDPIAQWDRAAHRWLLAQNVFTSPYAICIAVSMTPDALGTYYVYQFTVPGNGFPDYPKWGIWSSGGSSDGYYQAMNNFGPGGNGFVGPLICGYDRAKLLVGDPTAEQVCKQLPSTEDSLLPADVDSPTSPPSTEDEFFIGSVADHSNSQLSIYSMNWSTGNVTGPNLITVDAYNGSCSGLYGGDCVPQPPPTTDLLDSLGDRLMYRFAYWRDPPPSCAICLAQHWLVNFDVEASLSTHQIGVQWYEFVDFFGAVSAAHLAATTPAQQQTYAGTTPGDSTYRWMGSIARDNVGDILLGYSESNSNPVVYPSIALAGRMATDTPSQLSDEVVVVAGTGSQTDTSDRWGDYSSMRIDPGDNCTFWYTTEYYLMTQSFDWSTEIASAKFPGCH